MKYYKNIENGYIISVSTAHGQTEITKDEYDEILSIVKTAPQEEGYEYKLKEDLTWDRVEINEEELKAEEEENGLENN